MTDYEVRQQVLQHLYDNRHARRDGVAVPEIAETLGLDIELVMSAANQLDDLYQVRYENTVGGRGNVKIITDGITHIEGVGGSLPITVNQNTFNTSSESGNSNVNVGDGTLNSTQTNNVTMVTDVLEQLNALEAPPEKKEEAKSLVAQLTSNPLICAVVGGAVSGLV